MRNLISTKDIEGFVKLGKKVFHIEKDTIVTPAAKDIAKNNGVEFCIVSHNYNENVSDSNNTKTSECGSERDMIYKVLSTMKEKGLLKGMFESESNQPYKAEHDKSGLKLVRGNSINYEVLDTGNSADKVFYQEIINADDGCSMNAGFITIERCNFDWECACEELYHIIEGTLTVEVDGKIYTAHPGDSVFFPKGAKVTFGSPDKMKAFYATY